MRADGFRSDLSRSARRGLGRTRASEESARSARGPELAGHYFPYFATAAGAKESEASNFLEKNLDALKTYDTDQTVRYAIAALQSVLTADFKATEIEALVLRTGEPAYILTDADIDKHLTVLAETDL